METMSFMLVLFNFGSGLCWVCYGALLKDSFVVVSFLLSLKWNVFALFFFIFFFGGGGGSLFVSFLFLVGWGF